MRRPRLQREVSRRLAERLDVVKLVPSVALDAGCGTGEALGELRDRAIRTRDGSRSTPRRRWSTPRGRAGSVRARW
jgi:hypothetical protein